MYLPFNEYKLDYDAEYPMFISTYQSTGLTKDKTLIENQVPFAKENSDEIYVITKNTNDTNV